MGQEQIGGHNLGSMVVVVVVVVPGFIMKSADALGFRKQIVPEVT